MNARSGEEGTQNILDAINNNCKIIFPSTHVVYEGINDVITDIDENEDFNSGYIVSLSADGSVVAIGTAMDDDQWTYSGNVKIYKNDSGTWNQIGGDINGEASGDFSGYSIRRL